MKPARFKKNSSRLDTSPSAPPAAYPTLVFTQLRPWLPKEQLWPLAGCWCVGCCHGDGGASHSVTGARAAQSGFSSAWETQRIYQQLFSGSIFTLLQGWVKLLFSIRPTPEARLSFPHPICACGHLLSLLLGQSLFNGGTFQEVGGVSELCTGSTGSSRLPELSWLILVSC